MFLLVAENEELKWHTWKTNISIDNGKNKAAIKKWSNSKLKKKVNVKIQKWVTLLRTETIIDAYEIQSLFECTEGAEK